MREQIENKCTLSNKELKDKANEWVKKLAKSGGREWCLRIPVDFNEDADMIFCEVVNRFSDLDRKLKIAEEALDWYVYWTVKPRRAHEALAYIREENNYGNNV